MILYCKPMADAIKDEIKRKVDLDLENGKRPPQLVIIQLGNNPASDLYVKGKVNDCNECGIIPTVVKLSERTTEKELKQWVMTFNEKRDVDGVIVQLPLPAHISESAIANVISPNKDVDCFNPYNIGKFYRGEGWFKPCTPLGVMMMLEHEEIKVEGKTCVVVGRSEIVGKPMAQMLLKENGTVIQCHSKTTNLKKMTKQADILVTAVGKPNFIKADMVKEGAVVIDVGINKDEYGKTCGDVDFDRVIDVTPYVTPVPGGIGLMTRAALMSNVYTSYYMRGK